MVLKKIGLYLSLAVCLCFAWGCSDNSETKTVTPADEPEEGDPIEVVNGMVRFYLSESSEAARASFTSSSRSWSKATINVNGKDYTPQSDDSGKYYVEVEASSSDVYDAALTVDGSNSWYGSSAFSDLKLPYSQFVSTTVSSLSTYPMFASYSEATGNRLTFEDGFGVLDISLSGSADIVSVKVESLSGELIAGKASYSGGSGMKMTSGLGFAVLNCTDYGKYVSLGGGSAHFYVLIAPGTYSSGLKVTVCDSDHRASFHTTGSLTVEPNVKTSLSLTHSPDSDLMYFEGFDLFVWGGDIMGGEGSTGYAPTDDAVTYNTFMDRDGYADAYVEVAYNVPGSPYIQSDDFDEVEDKDVSSSHQVTESYVYSRNIGDYSYLYRVSEFQGCVGVSVGPENGGKNARGRFWTPDMTNIDDVCVLRFEFDFCWEYDLGDDIVACVTTGFVNSVTIDGVAYEYESTYDFTGRDGGSFKLDHTLISAPSSNSAPKTWHHAVVEVSHASSGARLYMYPSSTSSSVSHGFFLDNIEVRKLSGRAKNTVRLLYWNIQNGMWSDQPYDYDNFVEWVKKYDPDICVWNEAQSIYKDHSGESLPSSDRFFPNGWPSVAYRYGHEYTSLASWVDNYPQEVTSKYPITEIAEFYNTNEANQPLCHGASIQSITVNGTEIYFLTLHLWPQSYGYGVSTDDRSRSTAANEGDYYRLHEITYIIDDIYKNSEYAGHQNWVMLGDFNSKSPLDNWYYGHSDSDTRLITHSYILDNTDLVDTIAERFNGYFVRSWNDTSDQRMDYVYNSPLMYSRVVEAATLEDSWTRHSPAYSNTSGTDFYDPSDHYPIIIDYEL